jgi:hypothetical protein
VSDWRSIDLDVNCAFLDDKEHASRGSMLEYILSYWCLIGIHGIGYFFSFVFAQLKQQKMLADGPLDKL